MIPMGMRGYDGPRCMAIDAGSSVRESALWRAAMLRQGPVVADWRPCPTVRRI
jgi:hypothetical protein